jgi:hypothetical protein
LFRSEIFFRTTQELEYLFLLSRKAQIFFPEFNTKSVNNWKTENRNDPDLVQAFLKKWWVESDFKVPNLPLSVRRV